MFLRELHLQGFKSFAEPTVLTYTRELTAVVGPNGSGKSNVADAIRWVLGEQSTKLLRGKSSADVIFAGGIKKGRLGMAEVSMVLDNADGRMPVDYKDVVITRRVYRDGQSEYLLNNAPVRLSDIVLLLAKSGFGQKAYSVIGQGMIEDVLVAPASQRKEFFDEATGVRPLQLKREETVNKIKRTRENLAQAQGLFDEITPRVRSLKRQVTRLERRAEIETELRGIQAQYYAGQLFELQGELEKLAVEHTSAVQKKTDVAASIDAAQNELSVAQGAEGQSSVFARLQEQYAVLQEERRGLLQEKAVLQGERTIETKKMGDDQLAWLSEQRGRLSSTVEQRRGQTESNQREYNAAKQAMATADAAYAACLAALRSIEERLRQAQEQWAKPSSLPVSALEEKLQTVYASLIALVKDAEANPSPELWVELRSRLQVIASQVERFAAEVTQGRSGVDSAELVQLQQELQQAVAAKEKALETKHEVSMVMVSAEHALTAAQAALKDAQEQADRIEREWKLAQASASLSERQKMVDEELVAVDAKLKSVEERTGSLQTELHGLQAQEESSRAKQREIQVRLQTLQREEHVVTDHLNRIEVEQARLETRLETLRQDMDNEMGEQAKTIVPAAYTQSVATLLVGIQRGKEQLAMIGGIDPVVVEEYKQVAERYEFLEGQIADLTKGLADLEKAIGELEKTIRRQFVQNFKHIKEKFEEYFGVLFEGGKATLVVEEAEVVAATKDKEEDESDGEDAAVATQHAVSLPKMIVGVGVKATPPGKKLDDVSALSGGERAMTAIALICAIIANNPSPFVVLDEVDAALDEANSERFAAIVAQLAHKTQFICITHNRATMRQARILYGVTMGGDGVSQLLSVNLKEAEQVATPSA